MKARWVGFGWVLVFLVLTIAGTARADLFKCVVDGHTIFQDKPCAEGTQEDLCAGEAAARRPDICGGVQAPAQDWTTGGVGSRAVTGSEPSYGGADTSSYGRAYAPSVGSGGRVSVRGYTRKDGTYVRPHTRSAPRRR
jgi:hypothetical protein